MTALFADTFYWIALADFSDSAHRRALALTAERTDTPIVTTDEVLAEYLTFFATVPEQMRRKAVINARRILDDPGGVRVVPQSRESFLSGMALYEARTVPTRANSRGAVLGLSHRIARAAPTPPETAPPSSYAEQYKRPAPETCA